MIPVYLCDDEPIWLSALTDLIKGVCSDSGHVFEIQYFSTNPYELLQTLKKEQPERAVFFLDVELKCDMDGIHLAENIRRMNPEYTIVFVTTHSEMAYKTFEYHVEASDYILKDDGNISWQIERCLHHIHEKEMSRKISADNMIRIKNNARQLQLPIKNILFVETIKGTHRLRIHMTDGIQECYSSISDFLNLLDDNFLLAHKAFIVNIRFIQSLNTSDKKIYFTNGEMCPYSVHQYGKIKIALSI